MVRNSEIRSWIVDFMDLLKRPSTRHVFLFRRFCASGRQGGVYYTTVQYPTDPRKISALSKNCASIMSVLRQSHAFRNNGCGGSETCDNKKVDLIERVAV